MLPKFEFRSGKSMSDINYQLQLQGKSVKDFMTLVDIEIFVTGCANTCYKAIIFTEK